MRGATLAPINLVNEAGISIHAPHAGRDRTAKPIVRVILHFNPRAPCGARHDSLPVFAMAFLFQSTRPMRGATAAHLPVLHFAAISIHAPHAGRDIAAVVSSAYAALFQSTRPMRGAT